MGGSVNASGNRGNQRVPPGIYGRQTDNPLPPRNPHNILVGDPTSEWDRPTMNGNGWGRVGRGGFNPQQYMSRFGPYNTTRDAITNPGSVAASQGALTRSGVTAPGSVTGATASPANANPKSPTSSTSRHLTGEMGGRGSTYAQQLVNALRARAGG